MPIENFWVTAQITLVAFGLLWAASLKLKNVSIVDIFWGLAFVLISWTIFFRQLSLENRGRMVLLLVTLWGLRLSGYLAWRNWGKPEDYRYQKIRDRIGPSFAWKSFFYVFCFQALLVIFISLPLQVSLLSERPLFWLDLAGGLLVVCGISFETVGDFQLAKFKASPANRGKVMNQGLWRYTRHPNYFGDFLVWWGFYFFSVAAGEWRTLLSPLVMSFLLIRVSGVALLENSLAKRVEGYQNYISNTPAFFPWFPRKQ